MLQFNALCIYIKVQLGQFNVALNPSILTSALCNQEEHTDFYLHFESSSAFRL